MEIYKGIPVSAGVAIGKVYVLDDARVRIPRRTVPIARVTAEIERLDDALRASVGDLEALRRTAEQRLGAEAAKIFAFHQGLLSDTTLTGPMRARIERERVTAEYAAAEGFKALAETFTRMGDEAFATKVDDVHDLERRVLRRLIGEHRAHIAGLEEPVVVVAHDLTPSQAATFEPGKVTAFATDTGGRTSHTAIVAQALSIPAVVGIGRLSEIAAEADTIIVDGDRGVVVLNPDEATLVQYRTYRERMEAYGASLEELAGLPSITLDGTAIRLLANIEFAREAKNVVDLGGSGVGLFRTEFLWLTSDHEPTEEEQFEAYSAAVRDLEGLPITFRTFDLGADKMTPDGAMSDERNPFLGLRSIRYCLQNLPMFKRQLRAILRASALGPCRIMFPLVTTTLELRQAKMVLRDVMDDLADEGVPFDRKVAVGIMVEAPSAAVMANSFARESEFLSIGTNDLVQYVLAVDRTNENVASLYTPSHPAVLRLIKDTVRSGRREGVDVSVCGEIAGDVEYTMLLIGMGLRTLSMTPSAIPRVKRVVRNVDVSECERLARRVGSVDSERQVASYLREAARNVIPEAFGGRAADEPA